MKTSRQTSFPPPPIPPTDARGKVSFGKVNRTLGHRIVIYGPGGIGKTTLCSQLPGPVAFFDLDESLGRLDVNEVQPVDGIESWQDMRDALKSDGWDDIKSIVIDSATKAEELAVEHMLRTVKSEKGSMVSSIEGYGYGKGFQHAFETFLPLLADLDRHCRAGRHVVLVCHDCTSNVPNPAGDDWLRYEPRLQSPNSGKASVRLRVREWADHVLFLGYDVDVDKEGKGRGAGTRTIYTAELPHCMAKSRTTIETLPLTEETDVWGTIIR